MQLGSGTAVAVAVAGSYSSNSTPSLGTSICGGCVPKKTKDEKKKKKDNHNLNSYGLKHPEREREGEHVYSHIFVGLRQSSRENKATVG